MCSSSTATSWQLELSAASLMTFTMLLESSVTVTVTAVAIVLVVEMVVESPNRTISMSCGWCGIYCYGETMGSSIQDQIRVATSPSPLTVSPPPSFIIIVVRRRAMIYGLHSTYGDTSYPSANWFWVPSNKDLCVCKCFNQEACSELLKLLNSLTNVIRSTFYIWVFFCTHCM